MPYSAEISRTNPTAIFLVVDQSWSMNEKIANGTSSKAASLATVVNRILNDIVIRCSKGEEVFDYFDIAMIGYGNDQLGPSKVGSAFGGPLAGRTIVPISEIADYPIRIEQRTKKVDDGAGGLIDMNIDFPVWLEPIGSSGTPMQEVMSFTFNMVADWVTQHADSFPPIVIHITDGEPTDGDPRPLAESIRSLETNDGNVLLFNLHLSSNSGANQIVFPENKSALPDEYGEMLFDMSSVLPSQWSGMASELGLPVSGASRSFAFNADLAAMVRFLEIGTRQPTKTGP